MWEYFDDISVITIKESKRIDNFKKHMNGIGINNMNIYYFDPASNTKNERICSWAKTTLNQDESCCNEMCRDLTNHHLTLIEDAYNKGSKNVLIFEDDATFELPFDKNKLNEITHWLENNDWDIFFFGQMNTSLIPSKIINKNMMQIYHPTLSHAYVVNRKAMPKLIDYIKKNRNKHIDENLKQINLVKVASFPSMSYQDNNGFFADSALSKLISLKQVNVILDYCSYYSIFTILLIIFVLMLLFRKKVNC